MQWNYIHSLSTTVDLGWIISPYEVFPSFPDLMTFSIEFKEKCLGKDRVQFFLHPMDPGEHIQLTLPGQPKP